MSVVENVHAVVSRRSAHSESDRLVVDHNINSSDDDIDIIDKCINSNANEAHLLSSESDASQRQMGSLPPHCEPLSVTRSRDQLRRSLKYYFMSPIDKWRAKGRLPWKLGLQVIKIVFVTIQLVIFGIDMSKYLALETNMVISLRQLFLLDWDSIREVMTYPPGAGPYAIYEREQIFVSIDYAIHQFANISKISVGSFGYQTPNSTLQSMSVLKVCVKSYSKATLRPSDYYYFIDNRVTIDCININNTYPAGDQRWNQFSFKQFIDENKFDLDFERLVSIRVEIPMRTIYLNSVSTYNAPECYNLNVNILYDNSQHSGQILVSLSSLNTRHECNGNLKEDEEQTHIERQILNWVVMSLCLLSAFLCLRSIFRAQKLRHKTFYFFRKHFGKVLSFSEKLQFIDGWILMILLNDFLIISGSIVRIVMERNSLHGFHYNYCSLLLGVGNLLVWCGLLRYLGFFHKYNILIITLKHALPHVLRFLLCALILYSGFCFCGWVVLGPYHFKFRTISRTSECLFALMNGDDLFATFAITDTNSLLIWYFSRLYLYGFILLFIYVVLSLFIAIIMDSYETIKEYYAKGFPLNDLQMFVNECEDSLDSYLLDQQSSPTFCQKFINLCHNLTEFLHSIYQSIRH